MNNSKKEEFRNDLVVKTNEEKVIEVTRYIGKNSKYIRRAIRDVMIKAWGKTMMVKTLQAERDEKGRVIATTRLLHYANTAWIAYQIAVGLFPNDKYFHLGCSTAALCHDLGQDPYGHDGESARTNASKQNNGGAMLHNENHF